MKQQLTSFWRRCRRDAEVYPWRGTLLRMAADLVMVNTAIIVAFTLWFFWYTFTQEKSEPRFVAEMFRQFVIVYWFFWSLLALLIFHVNGLYSRARFYSSTYKAWIVVRSTALFLLCFVFADYFLTRGALLPRGVAALSFVLLVLTVGGSRLLKNVIFEQYRFEPVQRRPHSVRQIVVVGGAGYLGSTLVPMLLERGYKVRVLDSLIFGSDSLSPVASHINYEFVRGDVRDIQAVVNAMKGCDAVIHLAAIVGDPACEIDRSLTIEINRVATRMLVEIAKGYGVHRFLFASTCSVYGASDFLVDEHTQPVPISTYAETKVDSEKVLLDAAGPEISVTVLRLGTLFGLSQRPRFDLVVNLLTARAATKSEITIFNGEQWRPFLHVRDAARAFVKVLESPAPVVSGEIFNVGAYSMNLRLREVSEAIARIIPTTTVNHVENEDRRNYRASFDKIHTRLGFSCEVDLDEGIREIYEAIRLGKISDFTAENFYNHSVIRNFAVSPEAERSSMRLLEALAEDSRRTTAAGA